MGVLEWTIDRVSGFERQDDLGIELVCHLIDSDQGVVEEEDMCSAGPSLVEAIGMAYSLQTEGGLVEEEGPYLAGYW